VVKVAWKNSSVSIKFFGCVAIRLHRVLLLKKSVAAEYSS
jgi:hypothetical protein